MKQKAILLIIVVLIALGAWRLVGRGGEKEATLEAEEDLGEVNLLVDYGEAETGTYAALLCQTCSLTAFKLLQDYTEAQEINLVFEDSEFGVFVKEIGNKANTNDQYWLYYVNQEMGQVAADEKEIQAGDLVEWKYEKSQ